VPPPPSAPTLGGVFSEAARYVTGVDVLLLDSVLPDDLGSGGADGYVEDEPIDLTGLLCLLGGSLAAWLLCACLRLAYTGLLYEADEAQIPKLIGRSTSFSRRGRPGTSHEMI